MSTPVRLMGCACALVIASVCFAQPSGEEILQKVDAGLSGVKDYTVDLDVVADVERMNVPPMHVRMYYKKPDKFHFDSEGFALLPREGLAFSASKTLSRFNVEEVSDDTLMGKSQYRILLKPRDERLRITRLMLDVDRKEWKPTRIVSTMPDGHSITATFAYERQGNYLMPSTLTVEFSSASPADTTDQSQDPEMAPIPRPRMPRKGTVTIRYSHYEINTGLSDDVFNKK